jgi:hypothetical protein
MSILRGDDDDGDDDIDRGDDDIGRGDDDDDDHHG